MKENKQAGTTEITGEGFSIVFNNAKGVFESVTYGAETVFEKGSSMTLSGYRAPVDNDNWAWNRWFALCLYNLED